MKRQNQIKHIITKWNPMWNPKEHFERRTIEVHCEILERFKEDEQYVWWGKISKSGNLGLTNNDVEVINLQVLKTIETHLYLYCSDGWSPLLHVAKLEETSTSDFKKDPHTPTYYSKVPYLVLFWFRISDIRKLDFQGYSFLLREEDGTNFDPVSTGKYYPRIIYESQPQTFFNYKLTGGRKWFMKGGVGAMMPRCFKTGSSVCANPGVKPESLQQVFVAIPFESEYENVYKYGIKPALDSLGLKPWKANEEFQNIDIMCKICGGIQESSMAVIDISNWNVNVLFELGLIYGLGKIAFLIKRKEAEVPVDLSGMIYIPYGEYDKLKENLIRYIEVHRQRRM